MNRDFCAFVDTWLDDWLAGGLPADVARRIDAHVARCDRCRRLVAIVRDAETTSDTQREDTDLLASVLDRTTGSPCSHAEGLLPDLVDEQLDADTSNLLRDHVFEQVGEFGLRRVKWRQIEPAQRLQIELDAR